MSTPPPQTPRPSADQGDALGAEGTASEVLRLTSTVRFLGERLKVRDEELQKLIGRLNRTSSGKRRQTLWEQGNAVAADLVSLQSVYRDLMANLVNVKARSNESLRQDYADSSPKQSYDSGICMASTASSTAQREDATTRAVTPRSSATAAPQNPSSASHLRKLSGLSTAFSLYSHYSYPWLQSRTALVDAQTMEAFWPSQTALRSDARSPCAQPALWLLAAVVAVVGACIVSRPSGPESGGEEDNNHEDPPPPGPGLSLLVEVFHAAALAQWMKNGQSFSKTCFAARLRADLEFWEAFARERGLVAAAAEEALKDDAALFLDDMTKEERQELFRLLVWLVGSQEPLTCPGSGSDLTVTSRYAVRVIDILAWLGLRVSCAQRRDTGEEGVPDGGERVVSVRRPSSVCASPPDVETDSVSIGDSAGPGDTALLSTVREEDTDSDESLTSDADTDDTSIDEEAMSCADEPDPRSDTPIASAAEQGSR